jgi:TP901 family phage tail tape measure protein
VTTLDVAIRARFVNQFGAGAKAAERDLRGVKDAAQQIGKDRAAEKLAADLGKAGGRAKEAKRDVQDLRREADRLKTAGAGARAAADIEKIGKAARGAKNELLALRNQQVALIGGGSGNGGRSGGRGGGGRGSGPGAPGSNAGEVGTGAAVIGGALGRGILGPLGTGYLAKKSFDQAVSEDAAWAEVLKKINDADEAGFEKLRRTIRRLSFDLGIGRVELMGLTAEAGAAGIAYADLEKFMVLTGKAAIGWDMLPREASEKLAYTKAAMGLTIDQMDVLANKINALGDNSAAKERDILEMFLRVGSAAREAGVDTDSTLAMLAAVRSGGMESEVGARWFGALAGGMRTAAIAPKRVEKGFQMLGLSAKQVANGMKKDGIGTLMMLFERLEKSPKAVEAATQIFGREWWDETMRAKGGMAEIKKQLEFIRNPKNYQGSLDKTFAYQAATAKNHLEKTKELVSRIGEGLAGWTLAPFNEAVEELIEKWGRLDERASVFERWRAEADARDKLLGRQKEPEKAGTGGVWDWLKKTFWGDDKHGDVLFEWLIGGRGKRDEDLSAATKRGTEAAKDQVREDVSGKLAIRTQLEKKIGNDRYPDQEKMRAGAARIDAELKAMLGSPDLGPVAREVMEQYAEAISAEGTKATAEAQRIAAELVRILSITARPTIDVPVPKPSPGGPVGKQSSVGPTIHQHIYGGDAARVARLAQREQERSIRATRNGALHEGWAWT